MPVFAWISDLLPENLKLIDKLQVWGFRSFIFWSRFCFYGTVLGRLSQCSLKIFSRRPTMVSTFLLSPTPSPFIKKFLTVLLLLVNEIQFLFPLEICFWRYKMCSWRYISSYMPPMITFSLIIHFRILLMTLRTFEINDLSRRR